MKLFYNLSNSILKTIKRFPAVFLLVFCTAVCAASAGAIELSTEEYKELSRTLNALALSSIWCAVLSFPCQLFAEQYKKNLKKSRLIQNSVQVFCIAFCFIWYFFCRKMEDNSRIYLAYMTTFAALLAACPFALRMTQNDDEIVLNLISSLFQSAVIVSAISIAIGIILFAVGTLFNVDVDRIILPILEFCWIAIFIDYFIVQASRHHVDISVPHFLGVLLTVVLTPLYAVFMIVLYVYLVKCAVTKSLPMKDMNLFCSIATALYIMFAMSLKHFDTKTSKLFYKFIPFAVIPLIAVQIFITIDRVSVHGISFNRYASMLYILSSIIVLVLSLVRQGRYMLYSCPAFAVIALTAGLTPLNMYDVPIRSQTGIIYSILKKNGLYEDGKIATDRTTQVLSPDDKKAIIRAYEKLPIYDEAKSFPKDKFEQTFGFSREFKAESDLSVYRLDVNVSDKGSNPIDVSGFKEMYVVSYNVDSGRILLQFAGKSADITDTLVNILTPEGKEIKEPLVIKDRNSGFTLIIRQITLRTKNPMTEGELEAKKKMNSYTDGTDSIFYCYNVEGYAFR